MLRDFSGPSCAHDYTVANHRKLDPGQSSRARSEVIDDIIRTVEREDNRLRGRHQQLDREARMTSDVIGNEQRQLRLNWEKTHNEGFKATPGVKTSSSRTSQGVKLIHNGMTLPSPNVARPGDRISYQRALLSAGGKSADERLRDFRRAQAESSRVRSHPGHSKVKKESGTNKWQPFYTSNTYQLRGVGLYVGLCENNSKSNPANTRYSSTFC